MKYRLPEEVKTIMSTFSKKGFRIYAVGGCVRDMLIGRETKDWDFTTNALPEEIIKLFPDAFYDNKFGTVGIPIKQPTTIYEITTFRSEQGHSDHRHPDKIIWGETVEEDLARRDFTVNAMAYDGKSLIDPYGGQENLTKKIIKAVGDPQKRFREDALRLIRAVRFATTLGFMIDKETYAAIIASANLITQISAERIRDELLKILSSNYPTDGILLLKNTKLLTHILPEVEKAFGIPQKSPGRHHIYDVGTHLVMSLKHCPSSNPIVRLATLLHDTGKVATYCQDSSGQITFYNHEMVSGSIARNVGFRLKLSKEERELLYLLVRFHQFTVDERQTDSAVRRFIRNIGSGNIEKMLALRIGDRLGGGARETSWRLELFKKRLIEVQKQPFAVPDLKVDGYDVMKIFNIKSGPLIGKVLEMIFDDVVEGKIKNEREILLTRLKDFLPLILPFLPENEKRRGVKNRGISSGGDTDQKRDDEPSDRFSPEEKKGK